MTPALASSPVTVQQPPAAPKFAVGSRFKFDGYFGVCPADAERPENAVVLAIRLTDDEEEEWVDSGPPSFQTDTVCVRTGHYRQTIAYPKGWEYKLAEFPDYCRLWGWVTEAELIEQGYTPAGA